MFRLYNEFSRRGAAVIVLATGVECPPFKAGEFFQKPSLFALQRMGTPVSLELRNVKAVKRRNGAVPQLYQSRYLLAL